MSNLHALLLSNTRCAFLYNHTFINDVLGHCRSQITTTYASGFGNKERATRIKRYELALLLAAGYMPDLLSFRSKAEFDAILNEAQAELERITKANQIGSIIRAQAANYCNPLF